MSRRRLNRERVIAAAAELADAAGDVSAVALVDVARALGVKSPSLYNHVSGLDDLRAGMAVHALEALVADLRQASFGKVGRDALVALATAYRRFALAHPGTYPLVVRAPDPAETRLTALSQELVQYLQLILASMGVQGDRAIHAIRGLRALLHGFVLLETAEGFKLPYDRDDSFEQLVATFLDGLTA